MTKPRKLSEEQMYAIVCIGNGSLGPAGKRVAMSTLKSLSRRGFAETDGLWWVLTDSGLEIYVVERRKLHAARKKKFVFFKLRAAEHTVKKPLGSKHTLAELRRFFLADLGEAQTQIPKRSLPALQRLSAMLDLIPDEFNDGAAEELDRVVANAVARRLTE